MRRTWTFKLTLALLFALPALAWSSQTDDLRERLAQTTRSLALLAGLEKRVEARDPGAITELLAASETGPADALQAEVDLTQLRARVGALQEILDAVAAERATLRKSPVLAPLAPPATSSAATNAAQANDVVTTPIDTSSNPNKSSYEVEGFVADRSRLGRACWRGGRYLEGVSALEPLAGDSQADYWRARCLEKLQRHAEALELYRSVIRVAGDSPEGRSAREDLEFLEWSLAHGLVKTP